VVGINSQIYSSTGSYAGVSFSIPINIAMDAVRQLKDKGYVSRGMIGVVIQQVDAGQAKALGLQTASGALVHEVKPGSPADKAGLQVGDVIEAFNGTEILDAGSLPPMVAATKPGTEVTLKVLHQGKAESVKVKLGAKPRDEDSYSSVNPEQSTSSNHPLGFTVENMTGEQREQLGLKKGQGVLITNVQGRQAMEAHLRPGYVITMVGQHVVGSVKDFAKWTADVKPGDTVMLLVHDSRGDSGFV